MGLFPSFKVFAQKEQHPSRLSLGFLYRPKRLQIIAVITPAATWAAMDTRVCCMGSTLLWGRIAQSVFISSEGRKQHGHSIYFCASSCLPKVFSKKWQPNPGLPFLTFLLPHCSLQALCQLCFFVCQITGQLLLQMYLRFRALLVFA